MKYFALLTKLGENLIAQATALGTKIELTHMAVGDGGGALPTPDTNQTKLIAEKRRAAINTLFIDEKNKNQIIAEQIIPESEGGWWIREIGLFDKTGNLIAVANCPETYKPQLTEGSGRTQSIRMVLIVSHTDSVTLKIDPSVVLATREYVNTEITVLDKKIDALSAQVKLDLIKKFDKANISGVKGNDNDKVPSLNLFTTEIGKLQPSGNYIRLGEFGIGTKSSTQLTKYAKDWDTNGFWSGELSNGTTVVMGFSVNIQNSAYGFNFYARNSEIYYTCTENGVKGKELKVWTENNFNPAQYALLKDVNDKLAEKQPIGNYIEVGNFGVGSGSSAFLTAYAKDWNKNGFFNANKNNSSSVVVGMSCNHRDGLYAFNIYGRTNSVYFSTRENGVDSVIDGTFLTSENTNIDRNGYLRSSGSTVEMQGVPIGASIIWNSAAPIPDNFWPNEGRAFSASEYPELAKIFPTLRLPDDRGYAIRMADNGKNIDIGRTVGTYQEDAMQNIVGEIQANIGGSASGVFSYKSNGSRAEGSLQSGGIWTLDISTKVRTANETRMKNVAKILITRVK